MSKSDIWQFDPVDANNQDIEGIDVNTGWSPNQIGPSFRALMGRLARVCQGLAPWYAAIIDGAAATVRPLYFSTAFTTAGAAGYRWLIGANATAEAGSNAGSDLTVTPYSDAGTALAAAVTVTRATGAVACASSVTASKFVSTGGGANALAFSTNNCLTLTQTGGTAATGLAIKVSNVSSPIAAFYYGSLPVGNISTNGSTTSYATTSDYRLKTVYGPADAGTLIDAVPVYDASFADGVRRPMFLAHELQAAMPCAVTGAKDAVDAAGAIVPQLVDHPMLVPALWAEIQSLRRRVASLEAAK